jgi:23S rRNA pseudouridine1911/1915/1917 synthase
VAKTLPAMTALVRAMAAREVKREYLALAHGEVPAQPFSIEAAIGRDPVSRVRMAVLASGKPARTDVARLAYRDRDSAVRCTLHSGRTHQIRVHLAWRGHPLLADALYGGVPALGLSRQALHATRLGLRHPITAESLAWDEPLPADLLPAWSAICG